MTDNLDYIKIYLARTGRTDFDLFHEFFDNATDALYWLGRWRRGEVLPRRLNQWCKENLL